MNMNNGEEAHEYSKPYTTKGPATRAMNAMKIKTFHNRRTVFVKRTGPNPNTYYGGYYEEDPNDKRTFDELLPHYRSFIETAVDWREV